MSNLEDLDSALSAYSRRMGIEQFFRDCKKGGYNLEDTKLSEHRLIGMMFTQFGLLKGHAQRRKDAA